MQALRGMKGRGQTGKVAIGASDIQFGDYPRPRPKGDPRAHTGTIDPGDLLRVIDAHGGDAEAGLRYWFETHEGTTFGEITSVEVKEFSQ
jgi:hypothetical protein